MSITGSYISDIERGKAVPSEAVKRELIEIYRINRLFLDTGEGEMFLPKASADGCSYDSERFREIGVFALAGAGPARDLVEHEPIDTLIVPRSFWKPSIVAIRVKGRSMEPTILDGAIVGVDRDDRAIVTGYIYAVWIPYEGAVIKRVHMRPEQIIFRSDNPEHDDFSLPLSEGIPDMILGRVRWVWQGLEKQD
jgi:SOS-response transcriptional repressor LexA